MLEPKSIRWGVDMVVAPINPASDSKQFIAVANRLGCPSVEGHLNVCHIIMLRDGYKAGCNIT